MWPGRGSQPSKYWRTDMSSNEVQVQAWTVLHGVVQETNTLADISERFLQLSAGIR